MYDNDSVYAFNKRIDAHKRRIQSEKRQTKGGVNWKRDLSCVPVKIVEKIKSDGKIISEKLFEKLRENHGHINKRGTSTASNKKKHRKRENTLPLIYWY